jgi:pimeloyl-ACP methyl ester carboxylesterase
MQEPIPVPAFAPRRPFQTRFVEGGLRHHVRSWGDPSGRPVVMIHGSMDASITFQFLVDAMADDWYVVAPDLRGFGLTGRAPNYAFADYLLDLDGMLEQLFPEQPVPLVGHSLGGNVVSIYAGLRPGRVSRVVSLDGFGLPDRDAAEAPDNLARWLDRWSKPPVERTYPAFADLADRLIQTNPRLDRARALFLAHHLGCETSDGVKWAFDPRHRLPFATMFRLAEWEACVARVEAPVLWVGSGQTVPPGIAREPGGLTRRAEVAGATLRTLPGTGHNLHHDAPTEVARLVEPFLCDEALPA